MKILIVKASSLGDIVQSFPTLAYLRQKFPEARIDWVVEKPFAGLLTSHPEVNRVLLINTKQWRRFSWQGLQEFKGFCKQLREEEYDLLLDLQGNVKSSLVTFLAKAKKKVGFGWKTLPEKINYFFTRTHMDPPEDLNMYEHYLFLAQQEINDHRPFEYKGVRLALNSKEEPLLKRYLENPLLKGRPRVLVSPGTAWKNKSVTFEAMQEFLALLQKHLSCVFLFIWGKPEERDQVERLAQFFPNQAVVVDKLPLAVLQNLMSHMDFVISMDSMALHLASTTAVKTFSVFGPTLMQKFKPSGKNHGGIQGSCPYNRTFNKRCPVLRTCSTGLCTQGLSGKQLFAAFLECKKVSFD